MQTSGQQMETGNAKDAGPLAGLKVLELGQLIAGPFAAKTLGDEAANAKIAFLDALETQPTVDVMRDQGFMEGFGIDVKDKTRYGEEDDPRIVGHQWGEGAEEGGRTGMENLLQKDPDTNVVYTINEPTAAGAYEALKAFGVESQVLMTSVDGGCPGPTRDTSGDGLISVAEGAVDYGPVLVHLTTAGPTQAPVTFTDYPLADADGTISYRRTFPATVDHHRMAGRVQVVVHGIDLDGDGTVGAGLETSIPALCGGAAD